MFNAVTNDDLIEMVKELIENNLSMRRMCIDNLKENGGGPISLYYLLHTAFLIFIAAPTGTWIISADLWLFIRNSHIVKISHTRLR